MLGKRQNVPKGEANRGLSREARELTEDRARELLDQVTRQIQAANELPTAEQPAALQRVKIFFDQQNMDRLADQYPFFREMAIEQVEYFMERDWVVEGHFLANLFAFDKTQDTKYLMDLPANPRLIG